MALINESKEIANYINSQRSYLKRNTELFDIYQGNLKPYVDSILRETLTSTYYNAIKRRILPINILKRVTDKLATVYSTDPTRTADSNEEILEMYENAYGFNKKMNFADEFTQLFKAYALKPQLIDGVPMLKVLPYDRFLVRGQDIRNPLRPTQFMEFIGKIQRLENGITKEIEVWFIYTDEEFIAMDNDGGILPEFMKENEGINPFGFIPCFYGNRSEYSILPIQDSDTLELAKILPVLYTDLGGAVMFQCFSIIYGIDVDLENAKMSPNAFWSIKSDPQSEKNPQLGTIKPQADIDKVISYIKEIFSVWMESRGIRVGALGSLSSGNLASGVSKIIDEMDTFEAKKKSIDSFTSEEKEFWKFQGKMHNAWIDMGELRGAARLPEEWVVTTDFDEPRPITDRATEIKNNLDEVDAEVISMDTARKNLYPNWDQERIDMELEKIAEEKNSGMAEGLSPDQQEPQAPSEAGDS